MEKKKELIIRHAVKSDAADEGCERLEWWVHDWNQDAAKRYVSWGAQPIDNIRVYRLSEERLTAFSRFAEEKEAR